MVLTSSGNTDMANWSLELDKRVRLIMLVGGTGLAVGAEVKIMADSTLIANAPDVRRVALACRAERAVTTDTMMGRGHGVCAIVHVLHWLVERDETMIRVNESRVNEAISTIVPVRAVKTLVADPIDKLEMCQLITS